MCGIFGIVTATDEPLGELMVGAAQRLSYRGYDSVGMATIDGTSRIDLRKDVGKVDAVAERLRFAEMRGRLGILQLRWATFGAPSKENAQPHLDSDGDLVGAHNGNVVNNAKLRETFIAEGMTVRSTNDGESCVHAVERYVDRGENIVDAIRHAHGVLEGDYAFVIASVDDERLYGFKKGSGLVVGLGDTFTCCSSDLPSILPLSRNIVRVMDGEIVCLSADGVELWSVLDGARIEREPEEFNEGMDTAVKGGYPHFMLKEIHEQPRVAGELLHLLAASPHVDPMVDTMREARHLYYVGCGTSYHACMVGAVYAARLAQRSVIPVLAPQFVAQYGPALDSSDAAVFVSQSGETKDVLNALEAAERHGVTDLALLNVLGSTLAHHSRTYLPLACGYEISVPATKTFINQLVAFLYLALRMGGHSVDVLSDLPKLLERTIEEAGPQVDRLLPAFEGHSDFYELGYGLTYGIALEGALKLKEITYAHCEGALSTEFKHGPLSAVDEGYPVVFVVGPEDVPVLISAINEVTTRGGRAIAIAEPDSRLDGNAHDLIALPESGPLLNPILATIPLQLLAYRLCIERGLDPDFPRNLSKTLTVD
ncbi:MAG: glutamine--fructose-6-phosphate transaminase (isomerizing) [Acidobacteriota bacterium]|nr:glutamine--fructose-6-phosphate transaminase (isomerizing) [Acidobacteriota bacterium]